jgi:cell division initiation protein
VKITPLDIRRKEFKRSVRGYSDEEVDIFLDEVADEFERLFQENMELHDRMSRMDEQIAGHAQLKDALEKTLISAQLQAEELRANAHKESELILRDAEMKARGIVSDSYGETQKTQHTLVQLKLLEEDFRFKFRSLLEGYIRLLDQAPRASAGSEATPPQQTSAATAVAGSSPGAAREVSIGEAPVAPEAKPAPAAPVSAPVVAPAPVVTTSTPATTVVPPPAAAPVPVARPVVPAPFGETSTSPAPAQVSIPPAAPAMPPTQPVPPAVAQSVPTMSAPPVQVAPVIPAMPAAPAQLQTPPTPPAPAYRPAPVDEPPVATAPAQRPSEPVRPVAPPVDDDQPTHESTLGPNDVEADRFRWPQAPPEGDVTQEAETAEAALTQEATMSDRTADEPLRRFFFGRQLNDVDDTFQPEDSGKKEWNREFEW